MSFKLFEEQLTEEEHIDCTNTHDHPRTRRLLHPSPHAPAERPTPRHIHHTRFATALHKKKNTHTTLNVGDAEGATTFETVLPPVWKCGNAFGRSTDRNDGTKPTHRHPTKSTKATPHIPGSTTHRQINTTMVTSHHAKRMQQLHLRHVTSPSTP
jgi:hypothetical protein